MDHGAGLGVDRGELGVGKYSKRGGMSSVFPSDHKEALAEVSEENLCPWSLMLKRPGSGNSGLGMQTCKEHGQPGGPESLAAAPLRDPCADRKSVV